MSEKQYNDVEQEFFKFEKENDFVAGIYLSMQPNQGSNKEIVYNIEASDGKIQSFWGSTVLNQKMSLVRIGDDIKIIYLGKVKPDKGKEYHNYKIQKAE